MGTVKHGLDEKTKPYICDTLKTRVGGSGFEIQCILLYPKWFIPLRLYTNEFKYPNLF